MSVLTTKTASEGLILFESEILDSYARLRAQTLPFTPQQELAYVAGLADMRIAIIVGNSATDGGRPLLGNLRTFLFGNVLRMNKKRQRGRWFPSSGFLGGTPKTGNPMRIRIPHK
jgi:hypothetical protein